MEQAAIEEMYRLEDRHWWFLGKRLLAGALLGDRLTREPRPRILDVGCGTGGLLADVGRTARAVGVDGSRLALGYCRRRGVRDLACADAGRLPFRSGSFDVVMMFDVLEHYVDEVALLGDVRRLLRPAGVLVVSVPAFEFLWSVHDDVVHHVRRYTARRLRRALGAGGFAVQRLTYTNTVAFPPAVIVRGILQRLGLLRVEGTDFREHRPWVNRALLATYRLEVSALRRLDRLPLGLSVAALATPDGGK